MSQIIELKVPDIGDFTDVPVIEVFVKPGDVIKVDGDAGIRQSHDGCPRLGRWHCQRSPG